VKNEFVNEGGTFASEKTLDSRSIEDLFSESCGFMKRIACTICFETFFNEGSFKLLSSESDRTGDLTSPVPGIGV
jgi:hypothetical protein